jgi:hypothetical protein
MNMIHLHNKYVLFSKKSFLNIKFKNILYLFTLIKSYPNFHLDLAF